MKDRLMTKAMRILVVLATGFAVSGCITTSTGGAFRSADVSEERALQDYLQLSVGYLEQGDLVNTKRHLNNALRINPNSSEAYGVWGLVYSREGDIELADESFRRAIRLDGNNSQARNNYAAFLFAHDRYRDAYNQLERVVTDTTYRARSQAFENMGLAALRLDRTEDAEYAFNRALQLNPNQIRSSLELANIYLAKSDVLQARAFYRNFLALMQVFNVNHSARSLWTGIRLERALGNNVTQYAGILEERFNDSAEFQLYTRSLEENDE